MSKLGVYIGENEEFQASLSPVESESAFYQFWVLLYILKFEISSAPDEK